MAGREKASVVQERARLLDRFLRHQLIGAERARATSREMLRIADLPHHKRQVDYWGDVCSAIKWLQAHAPAYARRYHDTQEEEEQAVAD